MKYSIDNIMIKNAKNGSEYVELSLSDPDDFFNEPCIVPVFADAVIKGYKRAIEQATAMSATNQKPFMENLPEKLKWFPGAVWVTIPLPKPMFRRWGSEFETTDANGVKTLHHADDLICDKNNNPKLYTEFRVLCKETVDQEKVSQGYSVREAISWAHNWDPTSRGNAYISSFFVSAEQGVAPASEQAPVIQQNTAEQVQQVQQVTTPTQNIPQV